LESNAYRQRQPHSCFRIRYQHIYLRRPSAGKVTIRTNLLFRRAFQELMKQKGWNVPDILMEHEVIEIP